MTPTQIEGSMQNQDNYRRLMSLITDEINLPSPPAIAVQILNAVHQDEISLQTLGEIVSTDPALTAKMLKVANSGMFNHSDEITNIKRASTILGTNIIKNIALSFVITDNFNQKKDVQFDFEAFWQRSICTAVSAKVISSHIGLQSEDIFVTALLQDIGMLVMAQSKGNHYNKLLHEAEISDSSLTELEKKNYGFDHQQVGYALLTRWKLPTSITEPILNHHQPSASVDQGKITTVLTCADLMAKVYTSEKFASIARILQQQLIDRFELDSPQACLILDEAGSSSREIISMFELDPGDIKPYSLLLEQANAQLGKMHLSNEQLLLEMQEARTSAEQLTTELLDANTRLKELVYRDGLTGLYNHRYFHEALGQELARAGRYGSSVSLILFDIDYFKKVNDSFGHPAGDLVLMNIARAISTAVRPSDIVSRYGGEEFAVILPETNAAGVKVFAARLRRCVEGIATLADGQVIYVTISAGATTYSPAGTNISKDDLIDMADRGLYQSKKNGRNQVTQVEGLLAVQ